MATYNLNSSELTSALHNVDATTKASVQNYLMSEGAFTDNSGWPNNSPDVNRITTQSTDGSEVINGQAELLNLQAPGGTVFAGGNMEAVILDSSADGTLFVTNQTADDLGVFTGAGNNTVNLFATTSQGFYVSTGDGSDVVHGSTGSDTIFGGNGNDALYGGGGRDTIFGGEGNDTITTGTSGHSVAYGDAGSDQMYSFGAGDSLFGGDGADSLFAGPGGAYLSGDAGNDSLFGSSGNDTIFGGAGNDKIWAGGGFDSVFGGDGNDTIYAGDSGGLIFGDGGNDTIYSGNSSGGSEGNELFGGAGNDTFIVKYHTGNDTIDGGIGTSDLVQFTGRSSADATISEDGGGSYTITFTDGQEITVTDVEKLKFTDQTITL